MTTQAPSPQSLSVAIILAQAAASLQSGTERPAVKQVVDALLELEHTTRHQHITFPFSALAGQWRLCFTTGTRKARQGGIVPGKGFYMPRFAPAFIGFTPSESGFRETGQGTIGNQIQLGPLLVKFTGPCRYPGKKNLLVFDFTEIQIELAGRTLYRGDVRGREAKQQKFEDRPIATLPFFAFFQVTDQYIAARGRGGGLAIWVRMPDLQ